jgi:hypothetical protein
LARQPAGRGGVRVLDLEPRAVQVVDVVDLGAEQVDGALGVDHDRNAVLFGLLVPVADLVVEHELVLQTAATAAHDLEAQGVARATVAIDELPDLGRRVFGERDD